MLGGAALIVTAGVLIIWRERRWGWNAQGNAAR
jgi:hypothetical protein